MGVCLPLGQKNSWADSDIFSNRMYGSAMNSPENGYQISEGWFEDVTSLYDPDHEFVADIVSPGHNLYGFIDARYNFNVSNRGVIYFLVWGREFLHM